MKIYRWGNSLALRLPAFVVNALRLREGDDVKFIVAGQQTLKIQKVSGICEPLTDLRKYRGRLPANFKFDRQSE